MRAGKIVKRLVVILGLVVVALVAAVGLAIVFLDQPAGRAWVRPRAEALVSDALSARVSIGEITRLGRGGAALADVRIEYGDGSYGSGPLLLASSGRVGFTIVGLWPPLITLQIDLDDFAVGLERDQTGRWNLVEMFSSGEGPPPSWLGAVGFGLERGAVELPGPGGERLRFEEVKAGGVVRIGGPSAPLIALDELRLRWRESSYARLSGWIGLADEPYLELEAGVERIAGADLASLVPSWPAERNVSGWAQIAGPTDAPAADVHLAGDATSVDLWASLGAPAASSEERRLDASWVIAGIDPSLFGSGAPAGQVAGEGSVAMVVGGAGMPRELAADARFWQSRVGEVDAEWLTAQVRREGDDLAAAVQAAAPGGAWSGDVQATIAVAAPHATSIAGTVAVDRPEALLPEWKDDLAGTVLRLVASGRVDRPLEDDRAIEATLDLAGSRARGILLDEARAIVRVDPLLIDVRDLRVRGGANDLTGGGWLVRREPLASSEIGGTVAGTVDAALAPGFAGAVRTSLLAWGTADAVSGRLDASTVAKLRTPAGEGSLRATVDFARLGAADPGARAQVDGHWPFPPAAAPMFGEGDQEVDLDVDWKRGVATAPRAGTSSRAGASARVAPLPRAGGAVAGAPAGASRVVDAATVSLVVKAPEKRVQSVHLKLERSGDTIVTAIDQLALAPLAGDPWSLARPGTVSVGAERIEVEGVELRSASGRLALAGGFDRAGKRPSHLSLDLSDLDLRVACALADLGDCGGSAEGTITLAGTAARPDVSGSLVFDKLKIGGQSYGSLSLRAHTEGELVVDGRLVPTSAGGLTIAARLPLEPGWPLPGLADARPIDVRITGQDLDVAGLRALAPPATFLELRGRAHVDARVSGTLAAPHYSGTAGAEGLVVGLAATGATLRGGRVAARLDDREIVLTELSAANGGLGGEGRIDLTGDESPRLELRVDLNRMVVYDRPDARAEASGTIRLGGTLDAPEITGRLAIDPATIRPSLVPGGSTLAKDKTIVVVRTPEDAARVDANIPGTVGEAMADASPGAEPPKPKTPGFAARLRLGVEVVLGERVFIRRTDADIQLTGTLYATKAPGDVVRVTGQIASTRGWYIFQGRRLELEYAYVSFSGETPLDPYLDVRASYRVADYRIAVAVSGTSRQPTLDLSSQPPLDQSDILSVLLFGKPASQLTSGQGQGLQQQAVGLLASYVAPELERSVVDTFGLASLTFQMPTGNTAGTVGIGRYFGDDIFVSVAQDFGGPQGGTPRQLQGLVGSSVTIQYYLTPSVTLQGAASSQGESAIDVIWQKRY